MGGGHRYSSHPHYRHVTRKQTQGPMTEVRILDPEVNDWMPALGRGGKAEQSRSEEMDRPFKYPSACAVLSISIKPPPSFDWMTVPPLLLCVCKECM